MVHGMQGFLWLTSLDNANKSSGFLQSCCVDFLRASKKIYSHLIHSCQVWGQNNTILRKLEPLQNKAIRIINFKNNEYNVNQLYKTSKILKIADYIKLLNCLFVRDVIAQSTIPPFQEFFIQMRDTHQHNTKHAT